MKSNIKYYGALQKYTLSSDYPSNEIYLHIEDVEAIPIEWIRQYIHSIGGSNGVTKLHKEILKTMVNGWEKENEQR